jgi:hypothetical protein
MGQCPLEKDWSMNKRPKIKLSTETKAEQPATPMAPEKPKTGIVRASVYFPRAVHKALRKLAAERGNHQHDLIKEWIDAGLRESIGKGWQELAAEE